MRSWSLFFSSAFASVVSVLSLVVPFCLFLSVYDGNLFIDATERTAQRGIEVMIYLTPLLMMVAFGVFWLMLRCLEKPQKIFELKKIFKVMKILGIIWFSLIFLFQFLDGRMGEIQESLVFGTISLSILYLPLLIGLVSANTMYLKVLSRVSSGKITISTAGKYKFLQTPPL